jgi:hypothetical protein
MSSTKAACLRHPKRFVLRQRGGQREQARVGPEDRKARALHLELGVEAQAPDVAGDDEDVDRPRGGALDRHDHHGAGEIGVLEVAPGLVDDRLIVGLSGGEQGLAPDHPLAGGAVKTLKTWKYQSRVENTSRVTTWT